MQLPHLTHPIHTYVYTQVLTVASLKRYNKRYTTNLQLRISMPQGRYRVSKSAPPTLTFIQLNYLNSMRAEGYKPQKTYKLNTYRFILSFFNHFLSEKPYLLFRKCSNKKPLWETGPTYILLCDKYLKQKSLYILN